MADSNLNILSKTELQNTGSFNDTMLHIVSSFQWFIVIFILFLLLMGVLALYYAALDFIEEKRQGQGTPWMKTMVTILKGFTGLLLIQKSIDIINNKYIKEALNAEFIKNSAMPIFDNALTFVYVITAFTGVIVILFSIWEMTEKAQGHESKHKHVIEHVRNLIVGSILIGLPAYLSNFFK